MDRIEPHWEAAAAVGAFTTTRGWRAAELDGVLPSPPRWLKQVHGTGILHLDDWRQGIEADAAWTDRPGQVAAIRTADCLPILIAGRHGGVVAAVHAGWRGLAGGVVERVLEVLPMPAGGLVGWIGPAICGRCYQVGDEVRQAFIARRREWAGAFQPDGARWRADLKAIAGRLLAEAGVEVSDSSHCTFEHDDRFPSYRRDHARERIATLVWLRNG